MDGISGRKFILDIQYVFQRIVFIKIFLDIVQIGIDRIYCRNICFSCEVTPAKFIFCFPLVVHISQNSVVYLKTAGSIQQDLIARVKSGNRGAFCESCLVCIACEYYLDIGPCINKIVGAALQSQDRQSYY